MSNNKQSSVDKEFVPYKEALALKELGFDEPCFAVYFNTTQQLYFDKYINEFTKDVRTLAPIFSQAFRWVREKYDIDIDIDVVFSKHNDGKNYKVLIPFPDELFINLGLFTTYEEAELECLKKLIEIVQGGNNEQQ